MILAINSSTVQYSIALMTLRGVIIAEYMVIPKGNTFTGFMPAVNQLFESSGVEINKINFIAVATGPGSFTGLRVGLAAAKGIACSLDIPLTGISSVDALALSVPYTEMPVCSMITSRRDEAFYAFYKREEGFNLARQSNVESMKIKEIGDLINCPTVVVGNDFIKQQPLIQESGNGHIIYARQDHWNLRASSVGILGLRRYNNNDFDDVMDIVPDYQRPPDIRKGGK
ncbi:MAG: tRNA (adenosine(37)-N6)-threonylcarbamoyltransferase complex dimerization subunit type 1 TsaB [Deltaproteobacteria bacterium]|nr:tRNA (adenosine(37)-N6)-threonylcarbamoyltransferase complex dimerization subunit type 1 TsaB [Deltaproteobacteria bacterium]